MRKDPDGEGPNWEVLWLQMEKAILEIQKKMPFFPPGGDTRSRVCGWREGVRLCCVWGGGGGRWHEKQGVRGVRLCLVWGGRGDGGR